MNPHAPRGVYFYFVLFSIILNNLQKHCFETFFAECAQLFWYKIWCSVSDWILFVLALVTFSMNCSMCMCSLKQDHNFCEIFSSGSRRVWKNWYMHVYMRMQYSSLMIYLAPPCVRHYAWYIFELDQYVMCAVGYLSICHIQYIRFQINYLLAIDTIFGSTHIFYEGDRATRHYWMCGAKAPD